MSQHMEGGCSGQYPLMAISPKLDVHVRTPRDFETRGVSCPHQVGAQDVQYILDKVRGQHYQVACGKFFEARHKGSTLIETDLGGINHPNQYFEESQKFFAPKDEAAAAGQAAAEPRTADVA